MAYEPKALKSFFGYKTQLHTIGNKNWCCLVMNDPNNQYGFKKDKFTIPFVTAAGYVSEDNQHWLLGTLVETAFSSDGIYELEIKKPGDKLNEKTGKAQYVIDSEATDSIKKAWKDTGNLLAIKCDDIPLLKQLVIALHSTKYIVTNPVTVYIREMDKEKEATLQNDLVECLDRLAIVGVPTPQESIYQTMTTLSQLGVFTVPIKSDDLVPSVALKDLFGNVTETIALCVPYTGNLPKYTTVEFTPPKPIEPYANRNGGNNINAVYTPDERLTWVCNALKTSGVPIESDTILSLYNAIQSNTMYNSFYRMALQLSGVPVEGIGNNAINTVVTPVEHTPLQLNGDSHVSNLPGINDHKLPPMLNGTLSNGNGSNKHNGTIPPFDELDSKLQIYEGLIELHNLHVDPTTIGKRKVKEIDYLITILESRTYKDQLPNLIAWMIVNVGMNQNINTLKEKDLAKVAEAVEHNDTLLDINPNQNIANLVLS